MDAPHGLTFGKLRLVSMSLGVYERRLAKGLYVSAIFVGKVQLGVLPFTP